MAKDLWLCVILDAGRCALLERHALAARNGLFATLVSHAAEIAWLTQIVLLRRAALHGPHAARAVVAG